MYIWISGNMKTDSNILYIKNVLFVAKAIVILIRTD
jgi:hypothetical protein